MKVQNNLVIQHKCLSCEMHTDSFFCRLPPPLLQIFESLKITNSYTKGATIFMEGQPSTGVYMLCQGRVKLSTCSRDGRVIILRIAEAGEILGLSAAVSDLNYEATAEVIEPCQVNYVRKNDFLNFIEQNPEACYRAVKQISHKYHTAYTQVRSFGLSHTAGDKLAKLLLEWGKTNSDGNGGIRLKISYTHEEIAEMIGTSRETVTRILKDFRDRKLITLKGSELNIHDRKEFNAMIGVRSKVVL